MALLRRLANVSLDSLPLATGEDACFLSLAPLLFRFEACEVPWTELSLALESCFGSASAIKQEEIKAGCIGFPLVLKAFQQLEEPLNDDHEVDRDQWIVCLTAAVRSRVKEQVEDFVAERQNVRRGSAPAPPEALERAQQVKQDEEKESRATERQDDVRRPDVAASPRSMVFDGDEDGAAGSTDLQEEAVEGQPVASGSGLSRAAIAALVVSPARLEGTSEASEIDDQPAFVNPGLIYTPPVTRAAELSQSPQHVPRSLRPRESLLPPAQFGAISPPPQQLATPPGSGSSKPKSGKTKSTATSTLRGSNFPGAKVKEASRTDESTWVRLVAEALDKQKGPCSATAISNSLKPARRTPSARKQILRIVQRHVCFILVVKGVHKIRESTWALHKAWREHALLGRTSVEGRVESRLWCVCARPSSDGPMIKCVDGRCVPEGWWHCVCAGNPPEWDQDVDWVCGECSRREEGRAPAARAHSVEL